MTDFTKSLLSAALIIFGSFISLSAQAKRQCFDYVAMPTPAAASLAADLTVDSVMFRSDVTRVFGHIIGLPHSSARIDGFTITADPLGRRGVNRATDIDGFDFERRFQWEDSGSIPVEIDFPPMSADNSLFIRALYPGGNKGWKLTRVNRRKKR